MNTFYISFDDTDNLNSPGTGHILAEFLESLSWKNSFISRHQLFVSPNVPYTSHNSSMVSILVGEISYEDLIAKVSAHLEQTFAPGADPGLCVAKADEILFPEKLVKWGYRAKKEVLTKEEAYALAKECGVHLSEHGGTGQGVVGALAAVGLRLAGQDGRVKGKRAVEGSCMTVGALLEQTGFQRVCAYGQGALGMDEIVHVTEKKVKAVYQNFASTVLTVNRDGEYWVLTKDELKCY